MPGLGRQSGTLRPDWGEGWADLTCDTCGAGWTGPIGEPCGYCDAAEERQRRWQAEIVMRPPDGDPDDEHHPARMTAWGQRLKRAASVGLITEQQARTAWERHRDTSRMGRTGRAA